ncbi:hypothetical protein LTS08_001536 [Lithohypha guttulata]|nr:hypothetical protein LTS08_001536 [Lithohypha guttulata]
MARYRRNDMDLAYGDLPPPSRWDSDRFSRETQGRRAPPVIEQRPPYESARRREPITYDDRRFYEEDYYSGPRGSRDRRFYEEDEYYDPRAGAGAMVPFRPEPPARPAAPPRPRMMRRQSSVDRIDFERRRYYDDYRPPPPAPREREPRSSHYDIRIYDDVKVQDPDRYGDDGFREYREREWTRSRTRNDSPSPDRRAPARSEIIEAAPPSAYSEKVVKEETVVEKPYPRKGKTRMPKRLVHTKVLFDLGYPFYEEDEKTILIEKALGPDNIDEVFARSKEYREREKAPAPTEAPPVREWEIPIARSPSPGSSISQAPSRRSRRAKSQGRGSVHDSFHEDIHEHKSRHGGSIDESFTENIHRSEHRSISPARTRASRRSRARSRRDSSSEDATTIVEKRVTKEYSEISPARTARARSRRGTVIDDGSTIIDREIIHKDVIEESGRVDTNFPLAIALRSKDDRTDADIRREISRLERERRDLRREREVDLVRYDRRARRNSSPLGVPVLREPSPVGQIAVVNQSGRRDEDVVAVRKDKRGRMSLIV